MLTVDDEAVVRAGLGCVFDEPEGIELVGEAANLESGLEAEDGRSER